MQLRQVLQKIKEILPLICIETLTKVHLIISKQAKNNNRTTNQSEITYLLKNLLFHGYFSFK